MVLRPQSRPWSTFRRTGKPQAAAAYNGPRTDGRLVITVDRVEGLGESTQDYIDEFATSGLSGVLQKYVERRVSDVI